MRGLLVGLGLVLAVGCGADGGGGGGGGEGCLTVLEIAPEGVFRCQIGTFNDTNPEFPAGEPCGLCDGGVEYVREYYTGQDGCVELLSSFGAQDVITPEHDAYVDTYHAACDFAQREQWDSPEGLRR